MTEDDLGKFLHALPGEMFCQTCLARRFEVSFDEVRTITKRLRLVEGYRVETGTCQDCARMRVVFGFRPGVDRAVSRPASEPLCPVCLGPVTPADRAFRFHDQLIHDACDRSRQGPGTRP